MRDRDSIMRVSDELFIFRAMVVNAAQLASYSQAKQFILGTGYVKVTFLLTNSSLMDNLRPKRYFL